MDEEVVNELTVSFIYYTKCYSNSGQASHGPASSASIR